MQRIALCSFVILVCSAGPFALAGHHLKSPCVHCPKCHERCQVEITKEDVKKHCWKVECKTICIPRVTFPWQTKKHGCQSCCSNPCCCPKPAHCAKTRKVHVLKKHEYECKRCKYKWTPCSGSCCDGSCCGGCTTASHDPVPPQPVAEPTPNGKPLPAVPVEPQPAARVTELPLFPPHPALRPRR